MREYIAPVWYSIDLYFRRASLWQVFVLFAPVYMFLAYPFTPPPVWLWWVCLGLWQAIELLSAGQRALSHEISVVSHATLDYYEEVIDGLIQTIQELDPSRVPESLRRRNNEDDL